MAQLLCILPLILLVAARVHGVWDTTIFVSDSGTNFPSCRNNSGVDNACQTLQYAVEGISNSTQIVLLAGNHTLNTTIEVAQKQDIAITGTDHKNSVISCHDLGDTNGSGLHFENLHRLYVANVTFFGCGSLADSTTQNNSFPSTTLRVRSAVYILNSTNVTIEFSQFLNGTGVGAILYDVSGLVMIKESVFSGNAVPDNEKHLYPGGFGVYVEHTYCTPGQTHACDYFNNPFSNESVYIIQDTLFSHNQGNPVQRKFVPDKGTVSRILGRGGGLIVTLKGLSTNNKFEISRCRFINNTASDGGALGVSMQDFASDNSFLISNSSFLDNSVRVNCGSVRIGLEFFSCDKCVTGNDFRLEGIYFARNSASLGGAVEVFSSHMSEDTTLNANTISFSNCSWMNNTAEIGSAILLAPEAWNTLTDGYLPTPVFHNCTFTENKVVNTGSNDPELSTSSGALFISTYTVNFTSSVTFSRNAGTAIYINSGTINVLENTSLVFDENHGNQGGAVAMLGFSAIRIFDGSNVTFLNNHAADVGGAIYFSSTDETDYFFSRSCFLRSSDSTASPVEWQSDIYFLNNTAERYGHSIYTTSLLPCARAAATNSSENINVTDVFHGHPFHYSDPERPYNIASDPSTIRVNVSMNTLLISPGQVVNLEPVARDDLNNSIKSIYKASLTNSTAPVEIDASYLYVSDGNIRVTGNINSSFQLNLQTIGFHQVVGSVRVTLIDCPPGFVVQENSSATKCVCSTAISQERYEGITQCDYQSFKALLNKGFWAGCYKGELLTAECPLGYCRYVAGDQPHVALNKTCHALDEYLCGARNRMGLLCGDCLDNYTVFFHSQRYLCAECKDGHLGWLFYLLSEILPVTLLFFFIVTFNISLTSGDANSFILFAQVLDFFEVNSLGTFTLPTGVETLTSIYRFIFGIFNLDFFRLDALSFCLWNGATVLDVLVFKYITTAVALGLLLLLIVLFRVLPWCRCCKRMPLRNKSVIHGITAFLVVSYAQCAKVSFQVLTRIELMGKGVVGKRSVVFLGGTTEFLSEDHLPYAIPAIFVLLVFCTLPPILLFAYPAVLKVLGSPRAKTFNRCLAYFPCHPMRNLKPILDSFQGCFKDNFRFFAGLYFVYRLLLSAAFAFSTNAVEFYVSLEVIVVVMLALHAIAQPYNKRFYNIIDTILFADLAVINGISLYDYFWAQYQSTHRENLVIAASIQVVLIYVPIFYIAFLVVLKLTAQNRKLRHKLRSLNQYLPIFTEGESNYVEIREDASAEPCDADHLPARLLSWRTVISRTNLTLLVSVM